MLFPLGRACLGGRNHAGRKRLSGRMQGLAKHLLVPWSRPRPPGRHSRPAAGLAGRVRSNKNNLLRLRPPAWPKRPGKSLPPRFFRGVNGILGKKKGEVVKSKGLRNGEAVFPPYRPDQAKWRYRQPRGMLDFFVLPGAGIAARAGRELPAQSHKRPTGLRMPLSCK